MRQQLLYVFFSALIALNAAVSFAWAFGLSVHSWLALCCYVVGFTVIAWLSQLTYHYEAVRARHARTQTYAVQTEIFLAGEKP